MVWEMMRSQFARVSAGFHKSVRKGARDAGRRLSVSFWLDAGVACSKREYTFDAGVMGLLALLLEGKVFGKWTGGSLVRLLQFV